MDSPTPTTLFFTADELCQLLAVSRRTVRYWVSKGVLPPPWRLGPDGRTLRWHRDEVLESLGRTRVRKWRLRGNGRQRSAMLGKSRQQTGH
jgi:excisionase family DNA binding protein